MRQNFKDVFLFVSAALPFLSTTLRLPFVLTGFLLFGHALYLGWYWYGLFKHAAFFFQRHPLQHFLLNAVLGLTLANTAWLAFFLSEASDCGPSMACSGLALFILPSLIFMVLMVLLAFCYRVLAKPTKTSTMQHLEGRQSR